MCLYQRLLAVVEFFARVAEHTQGGFAVIRRTSPDTLNNVFMHQQPRQHFLQEAPRQCRANRGQV